MPLDESALDAFSRGFASELFAAFPWLRELAQIEANPACDAGSLWVRAPAPGNPCARTLGISTHNGEVTISFAFSHTHVSWPSEDGDEDEAIEILSGLFADRYLAEDSFRGRRWIRSCFPVPEQEIEALPGVLTVVSSWSGRLDRVTPGSGPELPGFRGPGSP
jgi:hypothetical protein